ncbi:helix-turn-helix domain-containing protein [Mucilaginibacter sp. HMF5004]|nr:helix-turn-helix domain-containing protein [Mucilaginibacter rivuli]
MPFSRYCKKLPRVVKPTYKEHPETIGEHIQKKRIEGNLTQLYVGQLIGVSKRAITMWERGRSQPYIAHYPKIIKFLGYYPFMEETETLGGTLLMSRRMHGLSAEELGKWFGVSRSTILGYERNKIVPSEQILILYYEFDIEQTKPLT